MKIKREFIRRPRIEMIPLIDVVFLLLVFFIYSMLSMTIHRGLPVNLPTASTSMVDKEAFITITVQRDGGLFLDDRAVDTHTLSSLLMQKRNKDPDIQVYLRADKDVSYQRAVEIMDLVRSAGIHKLALETQWEER
ncbi:MAG: biopolymer transporter ExbD [Deltaproteobacteria bacterium]|nr:biopolymer transporter ExbD [Deltaproteobacteria bacterium]